ncbi:hypothetical protein [Speluncibacter jeojiensis]|uniref:Uncharacterized protein n=1 Tax=Speluncibacter jeojiensis TaxID=2710754 RepID=A0A9X4RG11_9ACTN|nr:hypothetical protein [Corynebacteriales bacterium D3-21]
MKTVQVSCLPSSLGTVTSVTVQATPTLNLQWAATGQSLASMCTTSPIPGWLLLPAVDQGGFVTPDTHLGMTGWSYLVTVTWTDSTGVSGTESGTVQVFQDDATEYLINSGGDLATPVSYPLGGIAISGVVAAYSQLPASSSTPAAYLCEADNLVYVWQNGAWPPQGSGFHVEGPTGPQGPTGLTGPANTLTVGTVASGSPAAASISGAAPNQTLDLTLPQGNPAHWWTGSGAPGPISGALNGDMYLDTSGTGNVYQLDSGTWTLQVSIKGPTGSQGPIGNTGDTGPQGVAAHWWTGSGAPGTVSGAIQGDMYLDTSGTGNVYQLGASAWSKVASIEGPQGPAGTMTNATTSAPGAVQLAGILGGTATAPAFSSAAFGTTDGTAAQGNDSRITGAAPLASPTFTGTVTVPAMKVTAGTPAVGQVLTASDTSGDVAWKALPAASTSVAGVAEFGTVAGTAAQGNDARFTRPLDFTVLIQGGTRATGFGDMPEGILIQHAGTINQIVFQGGTADASGSTTVAVCATTTAGTGNGTAVSGGSCTATLTSAGATATLAFSGGLAVAAGTWLQFSTTAVGTTPGARLYGHVMGVWS